MRRMIDNINLDIPYATAMSTDNVTYTLNRPLEKGIYIVKVYDASDEYDRSSVLTVTKRGPYGYSTSNVMFMESFDEINEQVVINYTWNQSTNIITFEGQNLEAIKVFDCIIEIYKLA